MTVLSQAATSTGVDSAFLMKGMSWGRDTYTEVGF